MLCINCMFCILHHKIINLPTINLSPIASFTSDLSTILFQQFRIMANDAISITTYIKNVFTWPIRLGFHHLALCGMAPIAITFVLLSQLSPPVTWDLWTRSSSKSKLKSDLPILCSRARFLFSDVMVR